jgi:hypothetical protein
MKVNPVSRLLNYAMKSALTLESRGSSWFSLERFLYGTF